MNCSFEEGNICGYEVLASTENDFGFVRKKGNSGPVGNSPIIDHTFLSAQGEINNNICITQTKYWFNFFSWSHC